jgi:hypothetical protein
VSSFLSTRFLPVCLVSVSTIMSGGAYAVLAMRLRRWPENVTIHCTFSVSTESFVVRSSMSPSWRMAADPHVPEARKLSAAAYAGVHSLLNSCQQRVLGRALCGGCVSLLRLRGSPAAANLQDWAAPGRGASACALPSLSPPVIWTF